MRKIIGLIVMATSLVLFAYAESKSVKPGVYPVTVIATGKDGQIQKTVLTLTIK